MTQRQRGGELIATIEVTSCGANVNFPGIFHPDAAALLDGSVVAMLSHAEVDTHGSLPRAVRGFKAPGVVVVEYSDIGLTFKVEPNEVLPDFVDWTDALIIQVDAKRAEMEARLRASRTHIPDQLKAAQAAGDQIGAESRARLAAIEADLATTNSAQE